MRALTVYPNTHRDREPITQNSANLGDPTTIVALLQMPDAHCAEQSAVRFEDRHADGHDVRKQVLVADGIASALRLLDALSYRRRIDDGPLCPLLERSREIGFDDLTRREGENGEWRSPAMERCAGTDARSDDVRGIVAFHTRYANGFAAICNHQKTGIVRFQNYRLERCKDRGLNGVGM